MAKTSEEVLLIINHVRHKKMDGSLYLMGERLAWMQVHKNSFSISHPYSDIKVQKISPGSKEKVQLQILMHDGTANTFHFNHSQGREAQIRDRDAIKELLQQLLPQFRQKVNSELEEKNKLLQEDPKLFQLYKDLVVSQLMSAEEFWANHSAKFSNSNNDKNQTVGVSAAFLADIKPQTDGCNGLRYNLTPDVIESIFKTYPMVKKKHAENVPHKSSENEFWTKFFQSHYFHRDRINIGNKDMFSECAKNDEDEIKQDIDRNVSDPFLDLTQIKDTSLGEGYGAMNEESQASTNLANLSIIRRFNYHSTMVLKTCQAQSRETAANASGDVSSTSLNGSDQTATKSKLNPSDASDQPTEKKARIMEKIHYTDLEEDTSSSATSLSLTKMERYLHGPTPISASLYSTNDNVVQAAQMVHQKLPHWLPALSQVLPVHLALSVLGELSPGGSLMQRTSQQDLQQIIPFDTQEELQQIYSALCELLRHFWSCFPASSKFLEEKVIKMKSTLERFHINKLNAFKEHLISQHYSINLTGHMEEMLNAAYNKFETWQSKRLAKR
ncbi:general transcription factor IIH subunit 1 [Octopus bimaculoides]|uniref:BSD domain-containing protein n=1 Tax=Octopus bimaculoides TaxID=37653 RepID=A0A0L8H913_OCTBM|nr:general transcription factor IIH subunit 1 [Octopus bimaculoides]XP_014774391.1 general transcription factor IIH subunit 1 [Octopus bimaculoides]|eukprot:XP_014774390.1 PREDICTED: general transcription factor IIH subunit 1-like [Octopus bimaculoides]